MFEIKYVEFKNKEWNYLKIKNKNKIIILINKKDLVPQIRSQI